MTKDMTTGNPLRLIIGFAVPLMLGSLFQQFYALADTIIVGKFVGVDALAAVGLTGSLNYLVLGCATGVCCGFAIPVAQCFGAKDYQAMRQFFANSIWLTVIFASTVTVITVLLTHVFLVKMQTPIELIGMADAYIRTIFAGIPATLLYNIISSMMRALGDSKRPLYFLILASFLNIALDIVFILGFNMGVFGAAFATVVSQTVAGVASLVYFWRAFPELHPSKDEWKLSAEHCKKLVYIGIPMGLQCSITAIGSVMLQGAVNSLGSVAVAAQTAGNKAGMLLVVPFESLGTTMATYCSQNLGAQRFDRIRVGVRQGLLFANSYAVVVFTLLLFIDVYIVQLFLDASEVEIIDKACQVLFWNSVFYISLATLIVYRYCIQGLGYSTFAMLAGVAEMIARGGVSFLCVGENGFLWVCLANPVAWIAACIFLLPAYYYVMRRLGERIPQAEIA